jgi:hypothetical protein
MKVISMGYMHIFGGFAIDTQTAKHISNFIGGCLVVSNDKDEIFISQGTIK